jgi:hypothetical protein
MKEIDFSEQILKYKEDGLLADEKAGYPPKCKPGYEVSKDKKKCVLVKKTTEAAKTKKQWDKIHDLKKDEKYDKQNKGAKISSKSKNDLPDSDFAYIQPGGKKDASGKTTPRSLRHLPIPDASHVRNALARLGQTDISPEAKKAALRKIKAAAKKFGIKVSANTNAIDYSELY